MMNYVINLYENITFPRKMKEDFCGKLYSYKLKTSVSKLLLKNMLSEMLFNDNMFKILSQRDSMSQNDNRFDSPK